MHYDFDRKINRKHTRSVKWDVDEVEEMIPLWIADMDFEVARPILEAISKRAEHPVFGYARIPQEYYDATIKWFKQKHGWEMRQECFVPTTGVVPAIAIALKALTQPSDKVIMQAPIYNCFYRVIENAGCPIIENPLTLKDGRYTMDLESFEKQIIEEQPKVFLLCNPHNPAARVWTREELAELARICKKHGLVVIADEIHCELVFKGHRYTPFATVARDYDLPLVCCHSPSKSFNIAGLKVANIYCEDDVIRERIVRAADLFEQSDINPFGIDALIAAYTEEGGEWIDQLNAYVYQNYLMVDDFVKKHLPQWKVTRMEGTYLAWIDVSASGKSAEELVEDIRQNTQVRLNSGTMYSRKYGEGFVRVNMACPKALLQEALTRVAEYMKKA